MNIKKEIEIAIMWSVRSGNEQIIDLRGTGEDRNDLWIDACDVMRRLASEECDGTDDGQFWGETDDGQFWTVKIIR